MRIIELQDQGQDFTEFHLDKNNEIIDARPFQAWVWKGFRVTQKTIQPGIHLHLTKTGKNPIVLKYPVISVRTVRRANAVKSQPTNDRSEERQKHRIKTKRSGASKMKPR